MEDYKKKYEEALKWAKQVKDGKIGVVIDDLVEKFPELKESEDGRIKKFIINHLQGHLDTCKRFVSDGMFPPFSGTEIKMFEASIAWLEKQGEKHVEPVTIVERNGEQWIRVCAFGEDFIIAAHDYREGDKTEFTWEEACKIGTFSKKQGYVMLALKDEINQKLCEIGGKPLTTGVRRSIIRAAHGS